MKIIQHDYSICYTLAQLSFHSLQALQVVQSSAQCAVEGYRYTIIQEDLYEKAGDFMAEHLFPDEPLCKGIDLTWNPEIENIMMSSVKENMSLALISTETDEIIGLRVMQIETKDQHIETDDLKEESVKLFMNIVGFMENMFDVFKHYEVDEVFSFFGLSVHIDHRRKGLGLKLMQAAIIFIENLKVGPVVVKGDCDSVFSNRIYEKTGYTLLKKVSYEDFMKDNNIFIRCSEQHKFLTRFAKII